MDIKMVVYCDVCVTQANGIIQSVLLQYCHHRNTDNACTCSTGYKEQQAAEMETQSTEVVQIRQISQSPCQQTNTIQLTEMSCIINIPPAVLYSNINEKP